MAVWSRVYMVLRMPLVRFAIVAFVGWQIFEDLHYVVKAIVTALVPIVTWIAWYRLTHGTGVSAVRAVDDPVPSGLKAVAIVMNTAVAYIMVVGFMRGMQQRPITTTIVTLVAAAAASVLYQLWLPRRSD